MNTILDGKIVAQKIKDNIKEEVKNIGTPSLAVIRVYTKDNSSDFANKKYINNKKKACEYTGINFILIEKQYKTTQDGLIKEIKSLNRNKDIHGIIVQQPLPSHIDESVINMTIAKEKDVDGFNPSNLGLMMLGEECTVSCTPYGIMEIFKFYNINLKGKNVTVVGRSNIVGKPMVNLLINAGATVTCCNSNTKKLKLITKKSDIVILAIGKPNFFTSKYFKDGQIIIDVGINFDKQGKMCGDVDFSSVTNELDNISITPVPGGVGQTTVAMLLSNVVYTYKKMVNNCEDRTKGK